MSIEQEILAVINQIPGVLEKAFTAFVERHPGHGNQKTHGNRFGGYSATKESLRRLKDDKGARERYKTQARKKAGSGGNVEGQTAKGFKEAVSNMSPIEISKGEYERGLEITQRLDQTIQKGNKSFDKATKEKDPNKRKALYEESRQAGKEGDTVRNEYRQYISEVHQKSKGRSVENVVKSKEPVFIAFTGANNAQVAIRTREPRKGKFTVFGKTHTGREINATFDLKKNSLQDVIDQLNNANKKGAGYKMVTHSLDK